MRHRLYNYRLDSASPTHTLDRYTKHHIVQNSSSIITIDFVPTDDPLCIERLAHEESASFSGGNKRIDG